MLLNPFEIPKEVTIRSEPTQNLPWAQRDPSLEGKTGVSVFAESEVGTVRIDVWDTRVSIIDKLRQKRAAAVAGRLALFIPTKKQIEGAKARAEEEERYKRYKEGTLY